ncbi:MAG: nucleotide-binding protein [Polyangiaceae bacterium]|nr:nucleotide-binding protein [Polyangiaceae bacterium]
MKTIYVLFGSILGAAIFAAVRSAPPPSEPAPASAEPVAAAPLEPLGAQAPAEVDDPSAAIGGEVLEVIQVPNYSYLRVGAKGSEGSWVAVPTAEVAVGAQVNVVGAMKMVDFKSTALGRTFPVIYFGSLGSGAGPRAGSSPHGQGSPNASDPHASGMGSPSASVEVKAVARAPGPDGKTVAEAITQRTQLNGKTVRIRGTVVKVTTGVLGRTYLHLRDGSGDTANATNDITVTTDAAPALGDTILIEGVVAIDRDIGSGYKFPTIVENAKLIQP